MQEQSRQTYNREDKSKPFQSTRVRDATPDLFDPKRPRLGRRESEPHSAEVSYLYDVLRTNFPDDRVMWDLHHYFQIKNEKIDLQFDISYFRDLKVPYSLSSYHASRFQNRVPTMVINVFSKSTWRADIGEHVDYCKLLKIPIYVVFPAYYVTSAIYKPPFLRAYILQPSGEYKIQELREISMEEGEKSNPDAVIDVSDIVPFRLGLLKRKKKHEGDLALYRVILLDPQKFVILPTTSEKEKEKADKEKERADKEKERADKEKERADKEKERADKAERKIVELESKIKKLNP
ncbi:MAG: hypothetical protein ACTSYY_13485 [Promethearchaeota archaeon]